MITEVRADAVPMLHPRLKSTGSIPYGGLYTLNMPEKGFVAYGSTFEQLLRNIKAYRVANGLPNGLGLYDEVEREVCKRYPEECQECDPHIPRRTRASFMDVIAGTKVMLTHWWNGKPIVSQEEANERASICAKCPNCCAANMPCGNRCGELEDLVKAVTGSRSTPYDESLQAKQCSVCFCYPTSAVWVPLETQWNVLTDEQKELFRYAQKTVNCWKCPQEETGSETTPAQTRL